MTIDCWFDSSIQHMRHSFDVMFSGPAHQLFTFTMTLPPVCVVNSSRTVTLYAETKKKNA